MSVTVRPYRRGGWEVDVRVVLPDGRLRRERKRAPVSSKSAARRWGQAREGALLIHRPAALKQPRKEVPTLQEFAPRFLDGYARANRQKPSTIVTKEILLRVHLTPLLGTKRLDAITNEDVQRLKRALSARAPKTVNNVLSVLSTLLKVAVEWNRSSVSPVRSACSRFRNRQLCSTTSRPTIVWSRRLGAQIATPCSSSSSAGTRACDAGR